MKKIPIVFCFDDNLELQAGVCLTSLLMNAAPDTFYDIFILHADRCKFPTGKLNLLLDKFPNCKINYRVVSPDFESAFEIRGITVATYYRLLIPELIPEYDKIMYSDVDVIFQCDLANIYEHTDLTDYYVAGVSSPYSAFSDYIEKVIHLKCTEYISAGNIIMNSRKMKEDGIVDKFKEVAKENWRYQDMDTLNLVCRGKVKYLPPWYCVVGIISEILCDENQTYYSKEEVDYAMNYGIVHYNGPKPWQQYCINFDLWWMYYKKSIFFNPKAYHTFYSRKMNEYDVLSFWRRIKIVFRYFKDGKISYQNEWYEV